MNKTLLFYLSCSLVCLPFSGSATYSCLDSSGMPLDLKIANRIGINNGIFIEVGANDGVIQSNTKLLEERYGWTGILVEPSPSVFARLEKNRTHSYCYQCALGSFEQDNTFIYGDFDGSPMSSVDGKRARRRANYRVLVRSLQSILDEVNIHHVHFFSLDVEGYELQVLKGIDFKKTTFDYLLIEIYQSAYNETLAFLKDCGYEMVENFTNYNTRTNPRWDGSHNDYLFCPIQNIGAR